MIPLIIDRDSEVSLQEQLYRGLRDAIRDGRLARATLLPPSRDLACQLNVSRNTVLQAFDWLASEGLIEGRQGSGSYVADLASLDWPRRAAVGVEPAESSPVLVQPEPDFDFWYGRVDPRLFPLTFWRRAAAAALRDGGRGLAHYGPPAGDPQLRMAIAAHVATTRGIAAMPEQVIVTQGAQEALQLVTRLLDLRGSRVAFEMPGYRAAADIFVSGGAELAPVPVDAGGIDIGKAQTGNARAAYVTPSHQFPTGAVLTLERRRTLLDWCGQQGAWLIEDDYDGEIVYDRPPLMALTALDERGRTLYVGSFSKVLGSGLRIGYVIVPPSLASAAAELKGAMSYGQSWLDQQLLARFMDSGVFTRHVRTLRKRYAARRDRMGACLAHWLDYQAPAPSPASGVHFYCDLAGGAPVEATALAATAAMRSVRLYAGRDAGIWLPGDEPLNALVVGYAAYDPAEIEEAFARLPPAGR